MDEPATADARLQPRAHAMGILEDPMISTVPLTLLGERTLWSEDVTWLAEHRAWYTLGHLGSRVRWLHLYLEPVSGDSHDVLVRVQLDLAGRDLCGVCAVRATPQAALCAAFDLLHDELSRYDLIAG